MINNTVMLLILQTFLINTFRILQNSVQIDPVPECLDWSPLTNFINSRISHGISFSISPISNDFVLDKLPHLTTGKAAGLDDVSVFFLKAAAPEIHRVFLLVVFQIFGKLQRSPLFSKKGLFTTAQISVPFLFSVLCKKF